MRGGWACFRPAQPIRAAFFACPSFMPEQMET